MAILEARDLTKSFGGVAAVSQVTLAVEENEIYSIIGPNGAGKSTLFNLLSGRLPCDHGRVFFKGTEITGMPPEQNDFRLDLEEIRDMIRAGIFCVNVALSHRGAITACFAGDPVAAHRQGVAYIRRFFGATMKQPVDGVITNAYPMEINFKQSMKCVGNALPAVKPGGAVMGFLKADRGLDDIPAPDGSPLPLPVVKMILRRIGPSRAERSPGLHGKFRGQREIDRAGVRIDGRRGRRVLCSRDAQSGRRQHEQGRRQIPNDAVHGRPPRRAIRGWFYGQSSLAYGRSPQIGRAHV